MEATQIIEIIKATAGSLDSLIQQVAYFFAIGQAAFWLSFSFPLLIMFSVLQKVAKLFDSVNSRGLLVLAAWVCFSLTVFTGVRGLAHIAQAAAAPSIYVASEVGQLQTLLDKAVGK